MAGDVWLCIISKTNDLCFWFSSIKKNTYTANENSRTFEKTFDTEHKPVCFLLAFGTQKFCCGISLLQCVSGRTVFITEQITDLFGHGKVGDTSQTGHTLWISARWRVRHQITEASWFLAVGPGVLHLSSRAQWGFVTDTGLVGPDLMLLAKCSAASTNSANAAGSHNATGVGYKQGCWGHWSSTVTDHTNDSFEGNSLLGPCFSLWELLVPNICIFFFSHRKSLPSRAYWLALQGQKRVIQSLIIIHVP